MPFVNPRKDDFHTKRRQSRRICAFCRGNTDFETDKRQGAGTQVLNGIVSGTRAQRSQEQFGRSWPCICTPLGDGLVRYDPMRADSCLKRLSI